MLNLDPAKLLVIAVVAIILLGPDQLPQVARQVGGAWRSFNEFRHRMETEVRSTMPDLPSTSEIARLARSPSALLNHLSNMSARPRRGDRNPTNGDGRSTTPPKGRTATDGHGDRTVDVRRRRRRGRRRRYGRRRPAPESRRDRAHDTTLPTGRRPLTTSRSRRRRDGRRRARCPRTRGSWSRRPHAELSRRPW